MQNFSLFNGKILSTISIIKKGLFLVVLFLMLFGIAINISLAQDYGLGETYGQISGGLPGPTNGQSATNYFSTKVGQIVGIGLSFIGAIFLILIIYAGIMWMTAAGNDQRVAKAKEILIAATIGLVLVLSAYAITMFVGNALSVGSSGVTT